MDTDRFFKTFDRLIDGWCESKELRPLRHILNGKASLNGLTDGYEECLHTLRTIRAQHREDLTPKELDGLVDLIHGIE